MYTSLLEHVNSSIVGKYKKFPLPFVLYCDYTASGRSLEFIEEYIHNEVLPDYANTHTTTTTTARQTTEFREEARRIIHKAVNGNENDAVLFVGSGTTAAIHKLIHNLQLHNSPIVFIGAAEHHSNMLPWIELAHMVIRIGDTSNGSVDLDALYLQLKKWQTIAPNRQMIGAFSAGSNVSGILSNVDDIATLLHRFNALAFFDYATASSYKKMDMNPIAEAGDLAYKDAIYFAGHKLLGGVQSPGVLIVKKTVCNHERGIFAKAPSETGGGTVYYVRKKHQTYSDCLEEREEGGTPAIVGSIRLALVFQLKEAIGHMVIEQRTQEMTRTAMDRLNQISNRLIILGSLNAPRMPVFSFLIKHLPTGMFLHYNFVSVLFNDLFGIQTRSGCMCAGPYAQELLNIDESLSAKYETLLCSRKNNGRPVEIVRPGFVRLNLSCVMNDQEVEYVLNAMAFVAQHGWMFLTLYEFEVDTGRWKHKNYPNGPEKHLTDVTYDASGDMEYPKTFIPNDEEPQATPDYQKYLNDAMLEADKIRADPPRVSNEQDTLDAEIEPFRSFLLPSEAYKLLMDVSPYRKGPPYHPQPYPRKVPPPFQNALSMSKKEDYLTPPVLPNIHNNHHHMLNPNFLFMAFRGCRGGNGKHRVIEAQQPGKNPLLVRIATPNETHMRNY